MINIIKMLARAREEKCSDIHITEGLPIYVRLDGRLEKRTEPIPSEDVRELLFSMCTKEQKEGIAKGKDQDFAYEPEEGKRHRVNIYQNRTGLCGAIRIISETIPTLEDLSLPPVFKNLGDESRGLILLTGPTGSGKSTTLAAMVDYISKKRSAHILTVEDPIEYVFQQNKSIVHQREIGSSAYSFASALKSAMREDPDVILVGEMRDYETISTAVTAAETGHLVMSTLHTTGASQTIDRIIDTCPPAIQNQMRNQLSMVLRGIITQQLLPLKQGRGRIAATEILIGTDAVTNLIREDKCHQLPSVMQSSSNVGMHTLNGDLARMVKEGLIDKDVAVEASSDKADLHYYL